MEVWIRTQDKYGLKLCNSVFIGDAGDMYRIYTCDRTNYKYSESNEWTLGFYKTKEKALQVLDEIQNLLLQSNRVFVNKKTNNFDLEKLKPILNGINAVVADKDIKIESININTIVYQMPEK